MANSIGSHFMSGQKNVSAAGTAEALAATLDTKGVVIIARASNTNQVYIGASDVDSSTNDGLDAGEVLDLSVFGLDLADIFIDADTNGEGVDFYAVL